MCRGRGVDRPDIQFESVTGVTPMASATSFAVLSWNARMTRKLAVWNIGHVLTPKRVSSRRLESRISSLLKSILLIQYGYTPLLGYSILPYRLLLEYRPQVPTPHRPACMFELLIYTLSGQYRKTLVLLYVE